MWIFLNDAFLSVVADKNSDDMLLVRGRINGDIERVFPDFPVVENAGTDYRFRALVPRSVVADALAKTVDAIGYHNFKGSVKEKPRHHKYMHVWSVMEDWQSRAEAQERAEAAQKQPPPPMKAR